VANHRRRHNKAHDAQRDSPPHASRDTDSEHAAAPEEGEVASNEEEKPGPIARLFWPIIWLIRLLDSHNGSVTAAATIAIALLTFFLAKSASIQGQIMENQLADSEIDERAYLFPESLAVTKLETPPNLALELELNFAIKNYGKTPAIIHGVVMTADWDHDPPPLAKAFQSRGGEIAAPPLAAGDSTARMNMKIPMTAQTLQRASTGAATWFFFVHYWYADIFAKEHDCKRSIRFP
jgi:hypothetical protein